jgi:hypothetical protein
LAITFEKVQQKNAAYALSMEDSLIPKIASNTVTIKGSLHDGVC